VSVGALLVLWLLLLLLLLPLQHALWLTTVSLSIRSCSGRSGGAATAASAAAVDVVLWRLLCYIDQYSITVSQSTRTER
jgi:hypothetical protein